jgi:hypothetical protein
MKADQRPLMWVIGLDPAPTYLDETGQLGWNWGYQNIGKSIAYNVIARTYVRIGNERFQTSRNRGNNAIELNPSKPVDVPPRQQSGYGTVMSRPGINKEFFTQLMAVDLGVGILIEFEYSDASGKTKYANAVCIGRLASGAHAIIPPAECSK